MSIKISSVRGLNTGRFTRDFLLIIVEDLGFMKIITTIIPKFLKSRYFLKSPSNKKTPFL